MLLTIGAQAQTKEFLQKRAEKNKRINAIIANQAKRSAGKTTNTYWRIKSNSNYQLNGTSLEISDSTLYKYTSDRGSSIEFGSDLFLNDYGITDEVNFDTAWKYADQGSGLESVGRNKCDYDGNGYKILYREQNKTGSNYVNSNETRAVRDANGNITKEVGFTWNGTGWDSTNVTDRIFDSQGKVLSDSNYTVMGGAMPYSVTKYMYDGNGNLAEDITLNWNGSSWDSSYRNIYTYYTNNKLKTSLSQEYKSAAWHNSYIDSMGYGTADFYIYNISKEWDSLGAVWVNTGLEERTVNSSGLPGIVHISQWDSNNSKWTDLYEAEIFYDTYLNLTKAAVYGYIAGFKLPTPAFVANLYYEYYFKVGVNDVAANKPVIIYPNPATSNINVLLDGQKDAHITLTNMAGQTVRSVNADNAQKVSVNITGVPAGNYILSVESTDQAARRQMVTIQ